MDSHGSADEVIRFVRLARQLEMGGYYNGAKLFWALAFSDEVWLSNEALHVDRAALEASITSAMARLRDRGAAPDRLT